MSSDDVRRRIAGLLTLGAVACATAACGGPSETAAPARPSTSAADETTQGLAQVEFARQCTVAASNYPDEAGFTTDLDARLSAAGYTHEQWKRWHDALADSPELVAQYTEVVAAGCPAS